MERATKNLVGLAEHPLVTWMKEFMDSKVYPMFTYKMRLTGIAILGITILCKLQDVSFQTYIKLILIKQQLKYA